MLLGRGSACRTSVPECRLLLVRIVIVVVLAERVGISYDRTADCPDPLVLVLLRVRAHEKDALGRGNFEGVLAPAFVAGGLDCQARLEVDRPVRLGALALGKRQRVPAQLEEPAAPVAKPIACEGTGQTRVRRSKGARQVAGRRPAREFTAALNLRCRASRPLRPAGVASRRSAAPRRHGLRCAAVPSQPRAGGLGPRRGEATRRGQRSRHAMVALCFVSQPW